MYVQKENDDEKNKINNYNVNENRFKKHFIIYYVK